MGAHWPFWQVCPDGQTTPQAPQLAASEVRSRQYPLQNLRLLMQLTPHCPLLHTCPAGHAIPHEPQLFGSDARSAQVLPHPVLPAVQVTPHCPFRQTCPAGQTVPHAPQFFASDGKSLQILPQEEYVPLHMHWPPLHALLSGQVFPQPPQLPMSSVRSRQYPLQSVKPALQVMGPPF